MTRILHDQDAFMQDTTRQPESGSTLRVTPLILYPLNAYCRRYEEALANKGIRFTPLPSLYLRDFPAYFDTDVIHVQWLDVQIKQDDRQTHRKTAHAFLRAVRHFQSRGVRFCWSIHNLAPHTNNHPWATRLFYMRAAHLMDSVIVFSNWQHEQARRKFLVPRSKLFQTQLGHMIGHYPDSCTRRQARRQLGIAEDRFVYLFFGLIKEYKGVTDLVEAFRRVRRDQDTLLVAGKVMDKHLAPFFSGIRDPSIHVDLDMIPDERVPYYLHAADVCVFPYRRITNSSSIYLAMSFGKPVLCPRIGPLPEQVTPDVGRLYEPGQLEQALAAIRNDPLNDMGPRAQDTVRQYGWDRIAEDHIAAFSQARR